MKTKGALFLIGILIIQFSFASNTKENNNEEVEFILADFNVSSFTPAATTSLSVTGAISLTFNLDFKQPITDYPDVSINKVLSNGYGSWAITSSSILTFTPSTDWPLGSLITIKINNLESSGGDSFNGTESEFEFIVESGNDFGLEQITIETIATRDNGGTPHNIPLKLVLPTDRTNAIPIYFYVHGGGWQGGTATNSFAQIGPHAVYLAKNLRIATVGIAYRCSGSNGNFTEAIEDVETAYQWVVANAATYNLDLSNAFFGGGSAGTPLAALTTQIHTDVRGFVGFNGIYNFQENIGPFGTGNSYGQQNPSASANSAFYNLRANPPVSLFLHGDADTTIDYTQSTLFEQEINNTGGDAETVVYPGENHAFFNTAKQAFEDALYEMKTFLLDNGFAQQSILGVDENNNIARSFYQITPSVSDSIFSIRLFNAVSVGKIEVYNTLGQKLIEKVIDNNVTSLNLQPYSNGVYIIKVVSEDKYASQKVVLSK